MDKDVRITGWYSSVVQFHLLTQKARDFVDEKVQPEGWQYLGRALCVEGRYAEGLRELMLEHGLEVEDEG